MHYLCFNEYLLIESVTMAKRVAGRDLNHQNWDQEEEAETAGQFKKVFIVFIVLNRYIPRKQFLDPIPPPSYQFCAWISKIVL